MRSTRREPPSGFFRGSEAPRMMGMLLILFVLVMLIGQAADPRMWQWLVTETEPSDFGTAATAKTAKQAAAQAPAAKPEDKSGKPESAPPAAPEKSTSEKPAEKPAEKSPVDKSSTSAPPAEKPAPPEKPIAPEKPEKKDDAKKDDAKKENPKPAHADGGATEEDEEQQEAIAIEFQAISDRALNLRKEEMPAYWRLFLWAESQSFEALSKKARRAVVMNDFMSHPDEMRGKLVRLKLNLRRVLAYDAPDNPIGAEKIYELWGWSDESKAWLYAGVTYELPPDMPIGPDIHETVVFVGYFFKLQGYHEAGAKPNARPLSAPLLVGKLEWKPSPSQRGKEENFDSNWWIWVVGVTIVVLGGARIAAPSIFGASSAPTVRHLPEGKDVKIGARWDEEGGEPGWELKTPETDRRGTDGNNSSPP